MLVVKEKTPRTWGTSFSGTQRRLADAIQQRAITVCGVGSPSLNSRVFPLL
jgi:hypothetical protein